MRASPVHGMDHVGLTVPDIDQATRFFEAAFDAELIYGAWTLSEQPAEGAETEQALNPFPGTQVKAVRMLRLRFGPGLELFQMEGPEQREPSRPSDHGVQHFAIYVDDICAAVAQFEAAGGTTFTGPQPIMFEPEMGEGNLFCYGTTPWGSVIELLTYP